MIWLSIRRMSHNSTTNGRAPTAARPHDARARDTQRLEIPDHALLIRVTKGFFDYERVGYDRRKMTFLIDGRVGRGAGGRKVLWDPGNRKIQLRSLCHASLAA